MTYLNDVSVGGTMLTGVQASYAFDKPFGTLLNDLKLSANVTNVMDRKGLSTAVVTGNAGGYQAFPIAPRMYFLTLSASFQ